MSRKTLGRYRGRYWSLVAELVLLDLILEKLVLVKLVLVELVLVKLVLVELVLVELVLIELVLIELFLVELFPLQPEIEVEASPAAERTSLRRLLVVAFAVVDLVAVLTALVGSAQHS